MLEQITQGFDISPYQRETWQRLRGAWREALRAQCVVVLRGEVVEEALAAAVTDLGARHEILRTTFVCLPGMSEPVQVVDGEASPLRLRRVELAGVEAGMEMEAAVARLLAAVDLPPAGSPERPAIDVAWARLDAGTGILVMTVSALSADAASLRLLVTDLCGLYALRRGTGQPLSEPMQYADVAQWLNELLADPRGAAWRELWDRLPAAVRQPPLPWLRGPSGAPPAQGTFAAALPEALASRLATAAAALGTAAPVLLQACWHALLARLAGRSEVMVGTAFDVRKYEDLAATAGPLTRYLPVCCMPRPEDNLRELSSRLAGELRQAAAWQEHFSWESWQAMGGGRGGSGESGRNGGAGGGDEAGAALPAVCVEAAPALGELDGAGVGFHLHRATAWVQPCALLLSLGWDARGPVPTLSLRFTYDAGRAPAAEVSRLSGQFAALLASALSAPGAALRDLDYLGEAERRQLVVELNRTAAWFPAERCLHELIAERAREAPAEVAVAMLGGAAAAAGGGELSCELSYGELEARSNRLARHLVRLGVGADGRVGLLLRRSPDLVVALLAALKAGAAYVPLDPSYPRARLGHLLADCAPAVVVTTRELAGLVEESAVGAATVVCLDAPEAAAAIAAQSAVAPEAAALPANLAYVIYTSGSTGQPKGVMVTHRALVNYLCWCVSAYEMAKGSGAPVHSPLGFDLTVTSLLGPLLAGRRAVLIDEEQGTEGLAAALRGGTFSLAKLTPSHLKLLAAAGEAPSGPATARVRGVRTLVVGGEALLGDAAAPWVGGGGRLVNEYGPTETVVGCCVYEVGEDEEAIASGGAVPIGGPIANTRLYVLDGALRPVPRWVAGELCVGGEGVTRGYWRRPEATAASFVPDPFAGDGSRLYRTGDLALFRGDGALVFAGRRDDQVKIRGYRIELGEIEQALLAHPAVREAAVVAREDAAGERRLVAYLGSGEAAPPGVDELRRHLGERLPEYMLPAAFVVLAALPLNAHGKIDRAALPAPDAQRPELEQAYVAPRTATEELLAGVWSQVLGVERVGVHDSFLTLGGHSLMVTQVTSRIRKVLGAEVPVRALFEAPTLGAFAARVDVALRSDRGANLAKPPLARVPRTGPLPLSFAQQRLWFLDQLEPGNPAFNVPVAVRLRGTLARTALARTVAAVVDRHEILRTSYPSTGGRPLQAVAPAAAAPAALPLVDLQRLGASAREREVVRQSLAASRVAFDLAAGPVFRVCLLAVAADDHVLLLNTHHIASDAWSMGVLVEEVGVLYASYSRGERPALPEPPIQYADFAAWQRQCLQGEALAAQLAYWRRQLAGAPPLVDLPGDYPRPPAQSYRGTIRAVALPDELSLALPELARREGMTLFMVLLAAFKVLVHHRTGREDLVVGTDVANRNQLEVERLIGFFINQLVLRTRVSAAMPFRELLQQVREVCLDAYANQDVPFERLLEELKVERHLGHAGLFQLKLILQNAADATLDLPGLSLQQLLIDNGTSKLDLVLALWESPRGIRGWINYSSDLFSSTTVDDLMADYVDVLTAIVNDPDRTLFELLRAVERNQRGRLAVSAKPGAELSFNQFKKSKPKAVALPEEALVRSHTLDGHGLPLALEPGAPDVDVAEWVAANRVAVEQDLLRHGALLLRGFGIDSEAAFERLARSFCSELFADNGEHPRESVSGQVYTPVFFPPHQRLLWHNENSFNHSWPLKILFCCQTPAAAGGETPVVDSRQVFAAIDPAVRARFLAHGVMYVRNYGGGVGLGWQSVFQTAERAEVERRCRAEGVEYEWRGGDRLRTRMVRPAAIEHPLTGEPCWFNQAQHWHLSCLDAETRAAMQSLFAPEDLPRSCCFGDGSPVADEDMRHILDVYLGLEVVFPWQPGDVMVCDNVLAAHGRNPFSGERKLLVALGDLASFDEVATVEGRA